VFLRTALLVFATLTFGCPESSNAEEKLSHGCTGGITGGGRGGIIHSDGRISVWKIERGGSPRSERELPKNPEGTAGLFALLEELNFEDIHFNHPFYNMHCSLTLTTDGNDHTVSWGDGRLALPPKLARILAEVEKLDGTPKR